MLVPTVENPECAELKRLGDEIAELSAHLDAATARLLELIREFDAREGWGRRRRQIVRRMALVAGGPGPGRCS